MVEKINKITAELSDCAGSSKNVNGDFNVIRQKLENFQMIVMKDIEKRMAGLIDEVLQDMHQMQLHSSEFKSFAPGQRIASNNIWSNRLATDAGHLKTAQDESMTTPAESAEVSKGTKAPHPNESTENVGVKKPIRLPEKIFVTRESYLTALLEVSHMRSIYHIFFTILLVHLLNVICHEYFVDGRINLGLDTIRSGFEKIHHVLALLCLQHVFAFAIFYAFTSWAHIRAQLLRRSASSSARVACAWSCVCLLLYAGSQLLFGIAGSALCLKLDLPFVPASVLLLETIRLLMKMHAFVRSNAARVIAAKSKVDGDEPAFADNLASLPTFGKYVYFLFAPTLIYRDHYPRTNRIRWAFVVARLLEIVAITFLYSFIYKRHIAVHFTDFGREPLTAADLIVKIFGMLMPSNIIFLCGFYLILHSWLNFTAELLRFGDRMFYKDWWTAPNYDIYYRNWNIVVHDWLYEYVYKDSYTYIFAGSRLGAFLMVFLVSALVHEHILGFALQLFFPVMFVFFGFFGVGFLFACRHFPSNIGNLFMWLTLIFGNGLLVSLYCMEYFGQRNCEKTYNTWTDYFIPVVWSCYKQWT